MDGDDNGSVKQYKTRPNTKNGFWAMYLLPVAIIISVIKYSVSATTSYKLVSLLSTGLILTSNNIIIQKHYYQRLNIINAGTLLAVLFTTFLFVICAHKDLYFSFGSALFSTIIYNKIFQFVLNNFEGCFSFGEAGILSQSLVIFFYTTVLNITNFYWGSLHFKSNVQIATIIIQFGLLGIGVIAWTTSLSSLRNTKVFYLWSSLLIVLIIFLPLHIILRRSPVLWILYLIIDTSNVKLMVYWSFCSILGVLAVSHQIRYARKASTGRRKLFHVLALMVFMPGLLHGCSLLFLASGVVLGIFIALEILRILAIPPIGCYLQDGFTVFSDEKDGSFSLTPIYLLVGCSIPLWIHPSPCDVTDSGEFNLIPLMSGLLIIGLGDTAASIIGSNYGKFHWPASRKTIEGTLACILVQILFIYALTLCAVIPNLSLRETVKIGLSILVSSLIEAKTTQVDNLVLPLVMYNILII